MRSTLLDIIAKETMIDRTALVDTASLDDLGIESLDLVSVVFDIEEQFNVTLDMDLVSQSTTLGGMLAVVTDQIGQAHAGSPA